MLSVPNRPFKLSDVMPNAIMLNAIMLSVVILSVVAPKLVWKRLEVS
jgi:hypothetical protein